jgi:hypothetical protein
MYLASGSITKSRDVNTQARGEDYSQFASYFFIIKSKAIASHLYNQSLHPHIKQMHPEKTRVIR